MAKVDSHSRVCICVAIHVPLKCLDQRGGGGGEGRGGGLHDYMKAGHKEFMENSIIRGRKCTGHKL
jgi:hypothetical protein